MASELRKINNAINQELTRAQTQVKDSESLCNVRVYSRGHNKIKCRDSSTTGDLTLRFLRHIVSSRIGQCFRMRSCRILDRYATRSKR